MAISIGVGKPIGDGKDETGEEANVAAAATRGEECGGEWDGARSERRQDDISGFPVGGASSRGPRQ